MTAAVVDNHGYLYCGTCVAEFDKSGEPVYGLPHSAESCDRCGIPVAMAGTFAGHCERQGIRAGTVLESLFDFESFRVVEIKAEDLYAPNRLLCEAMRDGHSYTILNDELPEWRIQS